MRRAAGGRAWHLATLLALALFAVAAVPVAMMSIIASFDTIPQMRRDVAEQQMTIARSVNAQMARYFSTAPRELAALARLAKAGAGMHSFNQQLDMYVQLSSFYEAIYLIDGKGRVAAIGLPAKDADKRANFIGQDFSQRDFYMQARRDWKLVWSDAFLSPVSGRMAIAVAHPVGSQVLVGEVGLAPLPELAAQVAQGTGLSVMLLDRAHQLVAHSEDLFANQRFIVDELPTLGATAADTGDGSRTFPFNEQVMLGAASAVPGLEWIVVAYQRLDVAYARISELRSRMLTGIVVSALAAALAAYLVAITLTRAFNHYSHLAAAIGAGDYSTMLSASRVEELNDLQFSLLQMGAAIGQREAQMHQAQEALAQLNATLESRVEERTAELTRMNGELMQTLDTLRRTQDELIQSEKLASLGQLVANVAHEINTPIAAVKSSGANIAEALDEALIRLPKLFEHLSGAHRALFVQLLSHMRDPRPSISSREERAARRGVAQQLALEGIADAEAKADVLVQIGAHTALPLYLPLLRHPECELILAIARSVGAVINGTRNINTAVERVAKIVFALKSFSRMDRSGEMQAANLREGLDTVLTIYHNQIKQGVELVLDYQDIPPLLCLPDELNQVWTNLIHNALQAMDYRGTLSVGIRREGDDAVVSIGDSGCGIPDDIRPRIFEPFFTTKPKGEGSGLGLDIVSKIVAKHHGRIEVHSEVGVGTRFTVYLPYTSSECPK